MRKIFICYSHNDKEVKNALQKHLNIYTSELDIWDDRRLESGDDWKKEIYNALDQCNAAILLISIDFLNSKFITEIEIPEIFNRKKEDGIGVHPFIVSSCDWQSVEILEKILARPLDGKPYNKFGKANKDEILSDFAKEVWSKVIRIEGISEKASLRRNDQNELDKTKPLLDQIYDFISLIFKEINYYPVHKLVRRIPFESENNNFPYYSTFRLYTDSQEFFTFFNSLKIGKQGGLRISKKEYLIGVDEPERKSKEILRKLTENLIFSIKNNSSGKEKSIRYHNNDYCNCERCSFNRFDFSSTFQSLNQKHDDIENKFKQAFFSYKVGNYLSSAKHFLKLADNTKNKQPIWNFIAHYNLVKLNRLLQIHSFAFKDSEEVTGKLDSINLEQIFCSLKTHTEFDLIKSIYSGSFYSSAHFAILEILEKIKNHYYLQLNGGFSSSNLGWELINEYLQISNFIHSNYVIFDEFTEFITLTDSFIEGLIASHAMDESQPGKISFFDDYTMKVVIMYSTPKKIKGLFNRYKLHSFKYKSSSRRGQSIIDLFENLTENKKYINHHDENESMYLFKNKYIDYLTNFLVVLGFMELTVIQVLKITRLILDFIKKEESLPQIINTEILFFISRKGKQMSGKSIKGILLVVLDPQYNFKNYYMEPIATQIRRYHSKIQFSDNERRDIKHLIKIRNIKSDGNDMVQIVLLAHSLDDVVIRKFVNEKILESLQKTFSIELYYLASIHGIIDFDQEWFNKFRVMAKPNPEHQTSLRSFFGSTEINGYHLLNQFMNLCFKYKKETKEFNELKGVNPYYDWLLDIEGFIYEEFDPKWVTKYQTIYYQQQFHDSPKLMKKLHGYLMENDDLAIHKIYFDVLKKEA